MAKEIIINGKRTLDINPNFKTVGVSWAMKNTWDFIVPTTDATEYNKMIDGGYDFVMSHKEYNYHADKEFRIPIEEEVQNIRSQQKENGDYPNEIALSKAIAASIAITTCNDVYFIGNKGKSTGNCPDIYTILDDRHSLMIEIKDDDIHDIITTKGVVRVTKKDKMQLAVTGAMLQNFLYYINITTEMEKSEGKAIIKEGITLTVPPTGLAVCIPMEGVLTMWVADINTLKGSIKIMQEIRNSLNKYGKEKLSASKYFDGKANEYIHQVFSAIDAASCPETGMPMPLFEKEFRNTIGFAISKSL